MAWARRGAVFGGWGLVGGVGLLIAFRFVLWDSRSSLVAANAVLPLWALPLVLAAVIAVLLRRWLMLAATALAGVLVAVLLAPELAAATPVPHEARHAPTLRVFDANVRQGNDHPAAFATSAASAGADVVVFEEASPTFIAGLDASTVLSSLPYRATVARTDPFAMAVLSRFPLEDVRTVEVRGRPIAISADLVLPNERIRLLAVHAVAPFGTYRAEWAQDLRTITDLARPRPRGLLVVGDFNATWNNKPFRSLLSQTHLSDAAAASGHALQTTWPSGKRLVPPLIRIDHVLTTPDLAVMDIRRAVGRGSDHRALVASVAYGLARP